jgi:hypothetical protein
VGTTDSHRPIARERRTVRGLALFVSLALHAALAYALITMPWQPPELPAPPELPVIVLGRLVPPERRPPERPSEPRQDEQPAVEPEEPEPTETDAEPRPVDSPPEPLVERPREPLVEPPLPAPVADSPPPPTATELYDEGRAVAAIIIDQLAEEQQHYTFSTDLFDEEPAPAPNPRADMFEPGAGGKGSRALMQPGRARTRFGRWIADTCNALTGGFSIMGFASLCADETARSDLFADIKPEYLKSLPLCEQVDAASPLADDGERFAIKCRLVPRED